MAEDPTPSLDELGSEIDSARAKQQDRQGEKTRAQESTSGLRIGIELFAGVLVGIMMGTALDRWLDTKPVFLLICFLGGVGGSILNIRRYFQESVGDDD